MTNQIATVTCCSLVRSWGREQGRGCSLLGIGACPDLDSQVGGVYTFTHIAIIFFFLRCTEGQVSTEWLEQFVGSGYVASISTASPSWRAKVSERELYPTIVTTAVIICNRIERLDFLDERELLNQLLEHYTLSCGYNDSNAIGQSHYCIITLYFHLLNRSGHCQIVTIFICTQSLSSVISMCTYCIHKCLLQGLPTASEKKLIK